MKLTAVTNGNSKLFVSLEEAVNVEEFSDYIVQISREVFKDPEINYEDRTGTIRPRFSSLKDYFVGNGEDMFWIKGYLNKKKDRYSIETPMLETENLDRLYDALKTRF
jgi:hypothetical protein